MAMVVKLSSTFSLLLLVTGSLSEVQHSGYEDEEENFLSGIEWTRSQKTLSLQTGASVTVPCHYHLKYIQHKKYWCYDASSAYNYCRILAYANTTQEKVTVSDNPAQSLFTVSMRDLQKENSGAYWCAVEIGGRYEADIAEQLYLRVDSDPAVSVLESRVSGEEGSSVSVQCLYSAAYKKEVKKWCRSIDWTCYTVGRTNTSQNSAVQISDGGEGSFMVLMAGLKKTDAGWYWCSAGYLQVPVHLIISGSATRAVSPPAGVSVCLLKTVLCSVVLVLMMCAVLTVTSKRSCSSHMKNTHNSLLLLF